MAVSHTSYKAGNADLYSACAVIAEKRERIRAQGLNMVQELSCASALLQVIKDSGQSALAPPYRQIPTPDYGDLLFSYYRCKASVEQFLQQIGDVIIRVEVASRSDSAQGDIYRDSLEELRADERFFRSLQTALECEYSGPEAFVTLWEEFKDSASGMVIPSDEVTALLEKLNLTEIRTHRDATIKLLQDMVVARNMFVIFSQSHHCTADTERFLGVIRKYADISGRYKTFTSTYDTLLTRFAEAIKTNKDHRQVALLQCSASLHNMLAIKILEVGRKTPDFLPFCFVLQKLPDLEVSR